MTPEFWVGIIGQTIVIVVAIVASAIRNERRIATLESEVKHIEMECGRIPGISRALARLEGEVQSHRTESGH